MAAIHVKGPPERAELMQRMQEDAKYDVADGAGTDRVCIPDLSSVDEVLKIKAPAAPPKVPKVFVSGSCSFNCAYCGCRASRDKRPYCNEPVEAARICVDEAKRNGRGVFLSSAIYKNADYTQERIAESVRIMREELGYTGYIHAKVMPGADPALIERTGRYASRLSVNIEVAQSSGYERIARQKSRENILTPMGQISGMIRAARDGPGKFAWSQTTQLMAGSTNETDNTILTLAGALYKKYRLKRVYYTSFSYVHPAKGYDDLPFTRTPVWRMTRLYQADRLLELYGFRPDEILPAEHPNLEEDIDPKSLWAVRNLHTFPVEVNTADFELLLRVPGIGITYARRIVEARRLGTVTFDILRRIGVSLKRSQYFITAAGKFIGGNAFDNDKTIADLLSDDPLRQLRAHGQVTFF